MVLDIKRNNNSVNMIRFSGLIGQGAGEQHQIIKCMYQCCMYNNYNVLCCVYLLQHAASITMSTKSDKIIRIV